MRPGPFPAGRATLPLRPDAGHHAGSCGGPADTGKAFRLYVRHDQQRDRAGSFGGGGWEAEEGSARLYGRPDGPGDRYDLRRLIGGFEKIGN